MRVSLAERLEAARRSRFVGRTAECQLFQSILTVREMPFSILHIFGPGGVGKSTLLREFTAQAKACACPVYYLDGRNIDPTPDFFLLALQQALGFVLPQTFVDHLHKYEGRQVLLIDTYEKLTPLDGWLREEFLPQLPENLFVTIAGRNPPAGEWRSDPGWQTLVRILPLRNLNPTESQLYLQKRQLPEESHQAVLAFTHGHPLALSLMADLLAQRADPSFHPKNSPDIITALVERFIEQVPSPAHRLALEACALVRLTTEGLLAEMLDLADAHAIFSWLRTLSFIETQPHGLFPHDLARDAITVDLRWRNPDRYAHLHQRSRAYYMHHLAQGDSQSQARLLFDYIYLHRENPMVRPYFEWQETGSVFSDGVRPNDKGTIREIVARHEGGESARLVAHWLERQPQGVQVLRDAGGHAQGILAMIFLEQTTPEERAADPGIQAVWRYLQNSAPLRPGERATCFRFWMADESYQAVSPVQSRIFLNMVQHYLTTPGLAYTFIPCADPDFWTDVFAYADLMRLPGADFTIADRTYGVYGHDWRVTPPMAWLTLMGEREIAADIKLSAPPPTEAVLVLSEADFGEAVREGLRNFHDPKALAENPLLRSKLVIRRANGQGSHGRIQTLRDLIKETAAALQETPRQAGFYRAFLHTYVQPASTQEQAAELLDLPFSTYRRYLRSAIEYVTERLWQQELGQ